MKILVLTTQTTHHTKFVQGIIGSYPNTKAVLETQNLKAKFDTTHSYIEEQDIYEKNIWFNGKELNISDLVDTITVDNINDPKTVNFINEFNPDFIIVFGTGKILPDIIDIMPKRIFNLHGGDPEYYRGLDTHLWAIYHGEMEQLITCLHEVSANLDTGSIVDLSKLPLREGIELYQLRAVNTECCVQMVLNMANTLEKNGEIFSRKQEKKGRYYSFMPSVLKDICDKKFRDYNK